jgi:hypothetical protein
MTGFAEHRTDSVAGFLVLIAGSRAQLAARNTVLLFVEQAFNGFFKG